MPNPLFDLNIEEVLENWEPHHAIREIIANALDEQTLSGTAEIAISKDASGRWHVRDFGRGLKTEHFTMNESAEKLAATRGVIGKFGVGLKDALATFHRHDIRVEIVSRDGTFRLREAAKHAFEGIRTLHVEVAEGGAGPGTDFVLDGVTDAQMAAAKTLFLRFSGEKPLEETEYGSILAKRDGVARVYIHGVLAAEEPNFLFGYDITSVTEVMRKKLNRERLNVGRSTYTDRVKSILKSSKSGEVHAQLSDLAARRGEGDVPDELQWLEISQMALNILQGQRNVAFVTEEEIHSRPEVLDNMRRDGRQVIVVTEREKEKLVSQMSSGGPVVSTLEVYAAEYNESFQYQFVSPEDLTPRQAEVFAKTRSILALIGPEASKLEVRLSKTMRLTSDDTQGVWDSGLGAIVVRLTQLNSVETYAGTLLHEAAHALTGRVDATREFETVLTDYLGRIAPHALAARR